MSTDFIKYSLLLYVCMYICNNSWLYAWVLFFKKRKETIILMICYFENIIKSYFNSILKNIALEANSHFKILILNEILLVILYI